MKFVHDHVLHVGRRAFAQRDVGENFRRAAEDGRVAVHRGVAGAQADVVRPELAAERHEFFIHQRLDRAGVNRAPALGDGLKMQRRCHQRFARSGRRVEDDVLLVEQFQDGGFLRRIKLEPPALRRNRESGRAANRCRVARRAESDRKASPPQDANSIALSARLKRKMRDRSVLNQRAFSSGIRNTLISSGAPIKS